MKTTSKEKGDGGKKDYPMFFHQYPVEKKKEKEASHYVVPWEMTHDYKKQVVS